jgi:hypothetical protein
MTASGASPPGLDEPVRRYFEHAIRDDEDTVRSAACRAALEGIFAPACLLP